MDDSMVTALNDSSRDRVLRILAFAALAQCAFAQDATPAKLSLDTGKEIYEAACIACHGPNGKGMPDTTVGFDKPKSFPDFRRCDQTTPELNVDWKSTIRDGGHGRGFSPIMPSFVDALTSAQMDRVIDYLRSLCADKSWPRGEFNLPRPLMTEKAFPEDEVVVSSAVNAQGAPGSTTDIIYEQRFGARTQIEVGVPVASNRQSPGLWYGGVGDTSLGVKRVLIANLHAGSILTVFGGVIVPSGNRTHGLGTGVTTFESFAAFAQLLPAHSFVQLQAGTGQPTDTSKSPRSVFWRAALGKSFRQSGGLGRMWTPMTEFVANRNFTSNARTDWDIVPQFQVTLSQRQHVRANLGFRIPVTNTAGRPIQAVFYLLWDWFDGGLREGWR
jgi:mono/diheme cytochrome c family protein